MRRKFEKKGSTEKYLQFLRVLRDELTNNQSRGMHNIMRKYKVSNVWGPFLIKKQIIYRDHNYCYKWNDKISISIKIIQAFKEHVRQINIKNAEKRENNNQPELQFDMPQTPLPPKPKTRTKKVKVQQPVNKPTQQNEYGLIRRFLKFIW